MPTESFSLLASPWLPVIRRDATTGLRRRDWIRPSDLTGRIGEMPVVALDWQRPDLDAAAREFLIGLLATACPPLDDEDWRERWREPPTPDELAAAFAPYAEAFVLDGDGPRFMQDREELAGASSDISALLIDSPGEIDLFVKRGCIPLLSRAAAAMALYALQTFSPAGGRGHRTSLRGGGPLTTLALPGDPAAPLWQTLWLSVPPYDAPAAGDLARVFPWLAPTRTSEDGKAATTPADIDADGRQCFWGMPRRIRLDVRPAGLGESCALGAPLDPVVVPSYRTRPWGVAYAAVAHPLSPMYRQKPDSEWLFVHPQPDGITYRHWVDLVAESEANALRRRAACVALARRRLGSLRHARTARLLACGYDMDNMKARGFVEAEMPLFVIDAAGRLDGFARGLVAAANHVAARTAAFVGDALGTEKADATVRAALRERLFAGTQGMFFDLLDAAADQLEASPDDPDFDTPLAQRFLDAALRSTALALFDEAVPLTDLELRGFERAVRARRTLTLMLKGLGKDGAALFAALRLPVETPKTPKEPKAPKVRKSRKASETSP